MTVCMMALRMVAVCVVALRKELDSVWIWFYKEVAPMALVTMDESELKTRTEIKISQPKPERVPILRNWDYSNEALNSTTHLINRQKSARHLEILQFDSSEPRAVFYDHKRKRMNMATLEVCDCSDFNRQLSSKIVKPCMHIYRVAIEVGIIEPKYFGWQAEFVIAARLSREETERLQKLPADPKKWGGWNSEIHDSGIQRNRQYRAYLIRDTEVDAVYETSMHQKPCGWRIHGYDVALANCSCMDFLKRKLPCKHIYAAALASGVILSLGEGEFREAFDLGLEMVFQFPNKISTPQQIKCGIPRLK